MRTVLYNPVFINPQAYYVFPQLYDIEPKTDDFVEEAIYTGRLVVRSTDSDLTGIYEGDKEIDFSKYEGNSIRISQYTDEGSTVLGEWRLPSMDQEIDFSVLNYDRNMEVEAINNLNDAINRSYYTELAKKWNPNNTSMQGYFQSQNDLIFAPYLDTRNVSTMRTMFKACKALCYVPKYDTSKVTNFEETFNECSNIKELPDLDYSSAVLMNNAFRYTQFKGGKYTLYIPKCTQIGGLFSNCSNIYEHNDPVEIEIIGDKIVKADSMLYWSKSIVALTMNVGNIETYSTTTDSLFKAAVYLRIFNGTDFGKREDVITWDISGASNLGIDNDYTDGRAYESLIKSFVTDSFDRTASGYAPCTVTFHANTKKLFTEEHIEIMRNKGYNIA